MEDLLDTLGEWPIALGCIEDQSIFQACIVQRMCCTLVCRFRNLIIRAPYRDYGVQSNEFQLERGVYCSNLGENPSVLSFPMPLLIHQEPHVTGFMH